MASPRAWVERWVSTWTMPIERSCSSAVDSSTRSPRASRQPSSQSRQPEPGASRAGTTTIRCSWRVFTEGPNIGWVPMTSPGACCSIARIGSALIEVRSHSSPSSRQLGPTSRITSAVQSIGTLITTTSARAAASAGRSVVSRSATMTCCPTDSKSPLNIVPMPPRPPMIATDRDSSDSGTPAPRSACRSRLAVSRTRYRLSTVSQDSPRSSHRARRSWRISRSRVRSRIGTRWARFTFATRSMRAPRWESNRRRSRSRVSIRSRSSRSSGGGFDGSDSFAATACSRVSIGRTCSHPGDLRDFLSRPARHPSPA